MNYTFPLITSIEQVRNAIKDKPEFIEADRDDYIVFNYLVATETTFPVVETEQDAILRECRGLIFSKDGRLLSRRYHKFKNLNETNETFLGNINFLKPHVILEKIDGSMLSPLFIDPTSLDCFWATKMGITDIGKDVKKYVDKHSYYLDFVYHCHFDGLTPIFEWTSPTNQIVIQNLEEKLTLTAIRENVSGRYLSYEQMKERLGSSGIPLVKQYQGSSKGINEFLEETKSAEGIEGFVIRFEDGHMVKVKADWYVNIHRAKDNLLFEKNIIRMILDKSIDDIKPFLPIPDRDRLIKYETNLYKGLTEATNHVKMIHARNKDQHIDRKAFALSDIEIEPWIRATVFKTWQEPEKVFKTLRDYVFAHSSSQTKVNEIRGIFQAEWNVTEE